MIPVEEIEKKIRFGLYELDEDSERAVQCALNAYAQSQKRAEGLIFHPDFKLWYNREIPDHMYIIKEQRSNYRALTVSRDDVVLDLGGHIGASATYFRSRGAKEIFSYEPELENFRILRKNCSEFLNCHYFRAAILRSVDVSSTVLYVSPYTSRSHTLQPRLRREHRMRQEVPVISLNEAMLCEPTIIKCDVEGSEYDLFENFNFPKRIDQIAIEIHTGKKGQKERAVNLLANLGKQGFKALKPCRPEKAFGSPGVYSRR